jgi:hypothetical protein
MTSDVRTYVVKVIEDAGGLHSVADLAKRWGVTRARAHEMTGQRGFPEPLIYVGRSPLYLGEEVDVWRGQIRRPGRPAKEA